MTKIKLEIELEIDSDIAEEVDHIIQEMDYNFSYVRVDETVGRQLFENELIKKYQIIDYQ